MASFKLRFVAATSACLILIVAGVLVFTSMRHSRELKRSLQQRLISIATAASALIDAAEHDRLKEFSQSNDKSYQRMIRSLRDVLERDRDIKYLYTLRRIEAEAGKEPRYQFVLDGSAAGKALSEKAFDFSKLGDPYDDIPPHGKEVFDTGNAAVGDDFYTDKWGTFLSAYAPIKGADGKVVGVVGVDIKAAKVEGIALRVARTSAVVLLIAIAFSGILLFILQRMVSAPLATLMTGVQRIHSGNLNEPLPEGRRDEFGALMLTFNTMQDSIKAAQAEIARQSYLRSQLETAAALQNHLFNWQVVRKPEIRVGHFVQMTEMIGGDWCHYFLFQDRWLYMVCGDVTGHGVGAGIIASSVAGAFEALKIAMMRADAPFAPETIIQHLAHVTTTTGREKFLMTMAVAAIDVKSGVMKYISAGHVPSALVSRSEPGGKDPSVVRWISSAGDLMGLGQPRVRPTEIQLTSGDRVVMFSDGLIEARNLEGKTFGRSRLERVLRNTKGDDPEEMTATILGAVKDFAGPDLVQSFEDDVSLIVAAVPFGVKLSPQS